MKKAEKGITVPGNVAVAAIQPSPALIEELHNAQNNYLQLQDAGNNYKYHELVHPLFFCQLCRNRFSCRIDIAC